ncbi:LysR family transcriptional regulator [Rubellimicrobium arenae]|uniref:LysR family transcriptional regulator n=1 Tax=Rubellimicrobium arenae TaxID=2817372 RepID=UPI001B31338C|nr:LysR family transcriptional regulator [Rubellimicrobium arenae]
MQDLNDLAFFHAVATHQGFSAAARATGLPKATLSKRVALLEERLGIRLLERTTRRLRLTDVGQSVYEQVDAMLAGAEAAEAVAARAQTEPNGMVRVSCPQGLIQDLLIDILPGFLSRHPKVRVQIKVLNRRADLVEDGVDIALRARASLDTDPNLIVRALGRSTLVLVASPALLATVQGGITIDRLVELPCLSMDGERDEVTWDLIGPAGETRVIQHRPRLICTSFDVLRAAALGGVGVAHLPEHAARAPIASGQLVHLLPEWHSAFGIIHAVFSSRKQLVPAVRALIDHLAVEVPRRAFPL